MTLLLVVLGAYALYWLLVAVYIAASVLVAAIGALVVIVVGFVRGFLHPERYR